MSGWTARALARLTGVPAATVATWVSNGLVTPVRHGRGRGGHTIGAAGLLELLAVVDLREAGFSMQAIHRAVENLRALSGQDRPLAGLTIVVDGGDILWKDAHEVSDTPISALRRPGQRLMVFPIGEQHAECLQTLQSGDDLGGDTAQAITGSAVRHAP